MVEANNNVQQNITSVNTSQFSGMAFVGIKKVEYFARSKETIIFSDILELLENRNYVNSLMLGFFSTKAFGTEKVDKIDSILAMNDDSSEVMVKQSLKKAALFDFAEAESSAVDSVKIIIAADCIIHWDKDGSYIQPTQENAMLLDLEDIVKAYPENYKLKIYTQKDLSAFTLREFEQLDIFDIPVKSNMWYNQPTFQQLYGNIVLTAGLTTLALAYGALNWQKGQIEDLRTQISGITAQQINENYYSGANKDLTGFNEAEKYKKIVSIITKDISNSLSKSGFKVGSMDFEKQKDSSMLMVTITSPTNVHTQFSIQEPLAKRVIDNSSTIKAIRKKTTNEAVFILEALVDLNEVVAGVKNLTKGQEGI